MRTGRMLAVGALLLLVAAVPAAAETGSLQGRMALPLEVQGAHTASAADGAFLLQGADGAASLLVQGSEGKAERVVHRAFGFVNPQDPKLEVVWEDRVERIPLDLEGSFLTLAERRPEFTLLATDAALDLATGPAGGDLVVGLLQQAKSVDYVLDDRFSVRLKDPMANDGFSALLPAGLYQARSFDGRASASGTFTLFVHGATLEYMPAGGRLESIPAHFRIEQRSGTLYNPLTATWSGPGTHTEYVEEYLLVEASTARLDLQFAGLPGFLYAEEETVAVEGTAFLPAFGGTLVVEKEGREVRHEVRGDELRLDGRFTLHLTGADPADGTSDVRGDGDFTYVAYGAVAASYDWTGVAAAVGVGAVVVAAVVWIATQGKALLATGATGLVAGYARVHGSEVLEHPGRSHVYDMVKANPGVSFMELARSLSLGESTLTYHLRVLERNGFVSAVKDGRYLRYFDRQSGLYAQDRKLLVAALRNRATAAIAKEILRTPGIAQHELAERFHVAPSTVNWHIRRLADLGLVDLRRDHPHTRYFVGESWAALPAEEQARFQLAVGA